MLKFMISRETLGDNPPEYVVYEVVWFFFKKEIYRSKWPDEAFRLVNSKAKPRKKLKPVKVLVASFTKYGEPYDQSDYD